MGKWSQNRSKKALEKVMEKGMLTDRQKVEKGTSGDPGGVAEMTTGRDKGRGKPLPWSVVLHGWRG